MRCRRRHFYRYSSLIKGNAGLYLHFPFCNGKCDYCSFYSVVPSNSLVDSYTDALLNEIAKCSKEFDGKKFDTVFIGGGTPSLISDSNAEKIFSALFSHFDISENAEFTTEANPESLTDGYLSTFVKYGGNRLSLGVQSLCDKECLAVGRRTDKEKVFSAIELAKMHGIKNISCDLILGLPDQTIESLFYSIDTLLDQDIKHLSLYSLKIDKGTPLYTKKDILSFPDDDAEFELYHSAVIHLASRGLKRYEISNFALPDFESKHNLKYWNQDEYLGLGPAAHSFMNGRRFYNESDLKKYVGGSCRVYDNDGDIEANSVEERLMLSLRTQKGFPVCDFPKHSVHSVSLLHKQLISHGLAENNGEYVILTDSGLWVMNEIILRFIELI